MISDTCINVSLDFNALLSFFVMFYLLLMSWKFTYFGGKHLRKYILLLPISLIA